MQNLTPTLYGNVPTPIIEQAKKIKLLICDVDGVFSDGRIYMGNQGEELKAFHTRDGYGIKCLMSSGVEIGIITGRQSQIVENRMTLLGIQHIYQGQSDKISAFHQILANVNISPEQTAYIGDDLIDWPVMKKVGLSFCVNDAHPLLKQRADWTTQLPGGYGAVREVCDLILEAKGELDAHSGLSI